MEKLEYLINYLLKESGRNDFDFDNINKVLRKRKIN